MRSGYKSSKLRELRDQQVRFAPREKKVQQVERAERLIIELDPRRTYSYEYLCFRITEYRPEGGPAATMSGEQARHDLRLFVEDVSDAANLSIDEVSEPVDTVEDLCRRFNVSQKTIGRWRARGLVSRRFLVDGRKRVGFLHSSVERFVAKNRDRVERGERFSQLDEAERAWVIERARRLSRAGGGALEIARRLATRTGRSIETIRYTLRAFDRENPSQPIFPDYSGPLSLEAKERIYQQHRRGTSISSLADRFQRSETSIRRIVNEMRARRIMELPLDWVHNKEFERPRREEAILGDLPPNTESPRRGRAPSGLPRYLAALYDAPLLSREQELHLFRRFNFLKYKAARLRDTLVPQRASRRTMDEIESLYKRAVDTKNEIVQANLRLVVSIAKRHVTPDDDFYTLVSDGNVSLIQAVEKFDYGRGNKFSTYATWAIMKSFARTIPDEKKQRDRFRTSQEEIFIEHLEGRTDRAEPLSAHRFRQADVDRILTLLDEREQQIIIHRFGLNEDEEPRTLQEVGEQLGVTRERVRQLEALALSKMREAAERQRIDLSE